jgi:2-dehydropantoate 2-reductase
MKILVYGAGVIGRLCGGKLSRGGHSVTVVARGRRLIDIRQHGLVLEDIVHRRQWTAPVEVTECLDPKEDLASISVRRDQLTLRRHRFCGSTMRSMSSGSDSLCVLDVP